MLIMDHGQDILRSLWMKGKAFYVNYGSNVITSYVNYGSRVKPFMLTIDQA